MEVVLPLDFNTNSPAYHTRRFPPKLKANCYFSPTRLLMSTDDYQPKTSPATVPFIWEEKPGVPKSCYNFHEHDKFTFDVSQDFARNSLPAEDLFDGGVIKILDTKRASSFSSSSSSSGLPSSRSRRTKSFSPNGGWEYPWEDQDHEQQQQEEEDKVTQQSQAAINAKPQRVSSCSYTLSASSSAKRSRKWSFRDLFLFRSSSDGRAMERDPLKKYSANFRKQDEDFRNTNFRSIEPDHDFRSGSGSNYKKGLVSAHELHYKVNRAIANDMKKKTFLPYKQGILGRLAINPTVHAISNGFGFSHQNRV